MVSIVDDDETVRIATLGMIRSFGWDTCTLPSAQEFLNSRLVLTANCVISGVQMLGITGLELQQRLIADGAQSADYHYRRLQFEDHVQAGAGQWRDVLPSQR